MTVSRDTELTIEYYLQKLIEAVTESSLGYSKETEDYLRGIDLGKEYKNWAEGYE